MSKDTIYRQDVIRVIRHSSMEFIDADTRQKLIEAIPSADRPQGEWERDGHHIRCKRCNIFMCDTDREGDKFPTNYCPNCGARMKGADDDL